MGSMQRIKGSLTTIKEAKLVQARAHGETLEKAYDKAYDTSPTTKRSTKISNASSILNRPHVKAELLKALKANKVDCNYIIAGVKAIAEDAEKDSDKLQSLKYLGDLKIGKQSEEKAPVTNVLNVNLSDKSEAELMQMLTQHNRQ